MNYKPINFVVLRSSGIPIQIMDNFRISDNSLSKDINRFRKEINLVLKDPRLRDMMRVSTPNYESMIAKIKNSKSLLSQYHRKMLMYLQRGTSKCCTAGRYGPVSIGEFEHSATNLQLFEDSKASFIMIEDWALNLLLESLNLKVDEEDFHRLMEDYSTLKKFGVKELNSFVDLIDEYKNSFSVNKRDQLFEKIKLLFKEITGTSNWNKHDEKRRKDYESRAIFYELGKREGTFQIGNTLKKDFDNINQIIGIYLTLLTKKLLEQINKQQINSEDDIAKFVFEKFHSFSEKVVEEIIENNISNFLAVNYPFKVLPPIFSPDITVAGKNLDSINRGKYHLVIGEIHVSATVISNPMYEFKREKLIDCFVSALKGITNERIDFQGYKIEQDKDFTHHLPVSIQTEIISENNKTSNDKKRVYAYRSNKYLAKKDDLQELLFFPLAIGRKLIYNYHKDQKWGMWARDYIPNTLMRISKALFPELHSKLVMREEKELSPPRIIHQKNISEDFIFKMMDETNKWQDINKLGDKIFVRYSPTRKPIYVDLKNPFLVYELIKLSQNEMTITVSEFNPNEEHLWLSDKEGNYNSEFRYMVCPYNEVEKDGTSTNLKKCLYIPGYKSRLDELTIMKSELVKNGINVDSLNLDYNRPFEEICKNIASKASEYDAIVGLSFGAIVAMKVSEKLKMIPVFSINPFFERKKAVRKMGYNKCIEDISVGKFSLKNTDLTLIATKDDLKLDIKNSKQIKKQFSNAKLVELEKGGHLITDEESQKMISSLIINKIKCKQT